MKIPVSILKQLKRNIINSQNLNSQNTRQSSYNSIYREKTSFILATRIERIPLSLKHRHHHPSLDRWFRCIHHSWTILDKRGGKMQFVRDLAFADSITAATIEPRVWSLGQVYHVGLVRKSGHREITRTGRMSIICG